MASSILLQAYATTLLLFFLSPTTTLAATVLDIEGNPLQNEAEYYIIPTIPYTGLALTTTNNASSPCPLSIKRQLHTIGSPATIQSIANVPVKVITTGLPISPYYTNIETDCNEELRWWVTLPDEKGNRFVLVGVSGSGKFDVAYFFKIEEAHNKGKYVYNIQFCHVLSGSTSFGVIRNLVDEECSEVGLIDGVLGLTNKPFDVVFLKKVDQGLAA